MWDKNNLLLAIKLLVEFSKECWQLDRVADSIELENATKVLKAQLEMLLDREIINE